MPEGASVSMLADGRLHLRHGPIDLVIEAFGPAQNVRDAYRAAAACFPDILPALVGELAVLRRQVGQSTQVAAGPVARRMAAAVLPHGSVYVTPMAAVAGAVADHVLGAMTSGRKLDRAYVNNGGDIALYLAVGERFVTGMVSRVDYRVIDRVDYETIDRIGRPALDGRIVIEPAMPVRGIATSGRGGRSFSRGIADAVTVLAPTAADADAAATLIANAVDADHPAIERAPADALDPDSDLGDRPVTVAVGTLDADTIALALDRGAAAAEAMRRRGLIHGAVLMLNRCCRVVGVAPAALATAA